MTLTIRTMIPDDIPSVVELLVLDAQERSAVDPILWKMKDDAAAQIEVALAAGQPPLHQIWQVASHGNEIVGVIHSMMLPVPPIYAGSSGEPGLILPDSFVSPNAPHGTIEALLSGAEGALRDAGAKIVLASHVTGENWRAVYEAGAYEPLTLYLARTDIAAVGTAVDARPATLEDIPGIVSRSAENRLVLSEIDAFWEIHPEADARFSAWMTRSLTLQDRDMIVMGASDDLKGYIVAQPASRLHFPPAHDITGTGVIDDYYHPDLASPFEAFNHDNAGASTLLRAAEAALAHRGNEAAFVVCPAGWTSKIEMLEAAGYETAMTWFIKR